MNAQNSISNGDFSPSPIQQQVFTLSWLSSQAPTGQSGETDPNPSDKTGPWNRDELQTAIDNLKKRISSWNWKVVWGPNYTLADLLVPANAMFIAQQLDEKGNPLPVYVVAIAGTNASSFFDLAEDLDIDPADWKVVGDDSLQAKVTKGDLNGLGNLLGMDLLFFRVNDFLNLIPNKDQATLWFTGHSQGGALAPMLMLALMDPASSLDTRQSNLSHWKQVNLLATAGPSIGNQAFVDHFTKVFSAGNATTTFIWNANDVVPHAWNKDTMHQLTSPNIHEQQPTSTNIYGVTFPDKSSVVPMIASEQQKAAQHSYVQFEPKPAFACPLRPHTDSKNTKVPWTGDSEFLAQLGYQHLNAYIQQFNCTWFSLNNACDDPKGAQGLVPSPT